MKLKFIALLSIITSTLIMFSADVCFSEQIRRTQSSSSSSSSNNYIGLGITTSGVAAYSKLALTEQFSLRPMILFDDLDEDFNGTVVIPVTYDFELINSKAKPFVGIGGGSQTRNFDIGIEFTTGLDYQISKRLTATGLFNIQLFDDNDINAVFGLGFNF